MQEDLTATRAAVASESAALKFAAAAVQEQGAKITVLEAELAKALDRCNELSDQVRSASYLILVEWLAARLVNNAICGTMAWRSVPLA